MFWPLAFAAENLRIKKVSFFVPYLFAILLPVVYATFGFTAPPERRAGVINTLIVIFSNFMAKHFNHQDTRTQK